MNHGGIASVEPAVADGLGRGFGIVVVATHDGVAANDDLTHRRSIPGDFAAGIIDDANLGIGEVFDTLT